MEDPIFVTGCPIGEQDIGICVVMKAAVNGHTDSSLASWMAILKGDLLTTITPIVTGLFEFEKIKLEMLHAV